MRLLVATTNLNKLKEIREILGRPAPFELLTLADVPPVPEPQETGATFWENARIKALAYSQATGVLVVAEDSGLEIDALGGEPGVHSARFLGADATYPDRFAEIYRRLEAGKPKGLPPRTSGGLDKPKGLSPRTDGASPRNADGGDKPLGLSSWSARFVTALAVADGTTLIFETECSVEGTIAAAPAGDHGFGYDPIFYYPPFGNTTAQLTRTQKSSVSHRARAFRELARFLPRLER